MNSESDREGRIARLINDAASCGLNESGGMAGLTEVIGDYFNDLSERVDSDEERELDSDSDDELERYTAADDPDRDVYMMSLEDDEFESDHDSHTDLTDVPEADPTQLAENAALEMAAGIFEHIEVPPKPCHCKCKLADGNPCIQQFNEEEIKTISLNVREMSSFEKDLFLLGIICASINNSESTQKSKRVNRERQLTRIRCFYYEHRRICRDAFLFLMSLSKDKLTNLKKWYLTHGICPRRKKSGGRRKTALSIVDIQRVARFVLNFTEQHGIILPGRIPGFKRDDVKVLPSSETKASVWRRYKEASTPEHRIVGISTFRKLWSELLPYVVICKPMSDLCWTCQQNNNLIMRQINVPEEQKTEALRTQESHLQHAEDERAHFRRMCNQSKVVVQTLGLESLQPSRPLTTHTTFHYSFDFAQQVHFPSDPLQPGPIYFKTPRKCQIFGVNAEGFPAQVNYLIDESVACGKGANTVISLVHHFLQTYSVGEAHLQLNADNCAGQNKNNYMMWYLMWRVATGLNASATIAFMPAGHTKFSPDWCFGLLKRLFRRTKVSCLADIVDVVDKSTERGINRAQLVGFEDGTVIVPIYDWVSFLSPAYRRMKAVKRYHHFSVDQERPNVIVCKDYIDTPSTEQIIQHKEVPIGMPDSIQPAGLDRSRKKYLYDEIRQFCTEDTKDIVCPAPPTDE